MRRGEPQFAIGRPFFFSDVGAVTSRFYRLVSRRRFCFQERLQARVGPVCLLGLPTQFDDEVLLGCVQLTKLLEFKNQKVPFTRYELLKLLDHCVDGKNYRRV